MFLMKPYCMWSIKSGILYCSLLARTLLTSFRCCAVAISLQPIVVFGSSVVKEQFTPNRSAWLS
ncbi:hypothetical protein E2562_022444, partial [Oryza meyeriana var. granulata]